MTITEFMLIKLAVLGLIAFVGGLLGFTGQSPEGGRPASRSSARRR